MERQIKSRLVRVRFDEDDDFMMQELGRKYRMTNSGVLRYCVQEIAKREDCYFENKNLVVF